MDSSGTNCFYIDPHAFPKGFSSGLRGIPFLDNIGDLNGATKPTYDREGNLVAPKRHWADQFKMIADMPLVKL